MKTGLVMAGCLLIGLVMAGCNLPGEGSNSKPEDTATPLPTATSTPIPEHRIGVRVVGGDAGFYDRETGETFVPRGVNYIRLADQMSPSGETIHYHSTFNTDHYDPDQIEQALEKMHEYGFNVVRVFLNPCCEENSLGDVAGGLSSSYVANFADFLERAKANGIYVFVTLDGLPEAGGYIEILDSTWSEEVVANNSDLLMPGGIRANAQFWTDLLTMLLEQDAPIDAIFAIGLRNEAFFSSDIPPFNLDEGILKTANGHSYDMSSEEEKQRMMDEGLVYWIDSVRAAIREVDPTVLVTVGFFQPQEPNRTRVGDPRIIRTLYVIENSTADFIDLHTYPGLELTLDEYMENYGVTGAEEKPLVIGEFGVFKNAYYALARAATALQDWQLASCEYGFDGWLLWTWDTDEQTELHNGLSGEGQIAEALAPANHPEVCTGE